MSGPTKDLDPPPGRDFLVQPSDTFAWLAEAIDTAFARWDTSHLHEFTLDDDRRLGPADEDAPEVEDDEQIEISAVVAKGDVFTYIFDLGDCWEHRCRVLRDDVDPEEEFGAAPLDSPVPVFGWGTIPDQYLRTAPD